MAEYMIQDTTLINIANAIREKNKTVGEIAVADMPAKIRENPFGMLDTSTIVFWNRYNYGGDRNETLSFLDTSNGEYFEQFCYNALGLSEQPVEMHCEKAIVLDNAFAFCSDLISLKLHFSVMSTQGLITTFRNMNNLENLTITGKIKVDSNDLNLAYSSKLTKESIVNLLNALEDNTDEETQYYIALGSTNIGKLTAEEIQIATDYNLIFQ